MEEKEEEEACSKASSVMGATKNASVTKSTRSRRDMANESVDHDDSQFLYCAPYVTRCRMTNCELLRWLVEMPSRDVHHYRMMNVSAVDHDLFQ